MRLFITIAFNVLLLLPGYLAYADSIGGPARLLGTVDHQFQFEPGDSHLEVDLANLGHDPASGLFVTLEQQAAHGLVTEQVSPDRFRYTPGNGLYSLRSDSFAFRLTDNFGDFSVGTIFITLRTDDLLILEDDFEEETFNFQAGTQGLAENGTVSVSSEAALEGGRGLLATVHVGGSKALLELGSTTGTGDPHEPGRIKVLGCDFENIDEAFSILSVGLTQDFTGTRSPNARVVLEGIDGDPQHVAINVEMKDAQGNWSSSSPAIIDHQIQNIDFDWWPSTLGAANGGAILRVDGQVLVVEGLETAELSTAQVGILPIDGSADSRIRFAYDRLEYFAQGQTVNESLVTVQGFESQQLLDWTSSFGNSLELVKHGALGGSYLLEAEMALGNGFEVMELPPNAGSSVAGEEEVFVRVTVDVSDLQMVPGDLFRFLDLGSAADSKFGFPHANLRVTAFQGILHVALYGGPNRNTVWKKLTGEHQIDLKWKTSYNSGVMAHGFVSLWVDGQRVDVVRHLDIEGEVVNWLRLGVMGVDANTTGEIRFDDLMVWR